MLSVIQYSFNAVMPIILMILAGVLARRAGFLDSVTLRNVNKFNFRFNLCALMFVNIYEVDSIRHIPVRMGLFILLVLTVLLLLGLLLSGVFARERFRRGVLVQAQFRSNYAVIGLPVVTALAGDAGAQMASFLQFPTIMFYNFMSVIVLMIFADYEAQYRLYNEGPLADMRPEEREKMPAPSAGMDIAAILKGIAANPLIQGLTAGFAVLLLERYPLALFRHKLSRQNGDPSGSGGSGRPAGDERNQRIPYRADCGCHYAFNCRAGDWIRPDPGGCQDGISGSWTGRNGSPDCRVRLTGCSFLHCHVFRDGRRRPPCRTDCCLDQHTGYGLPVLYRIFYAAGRTAVAGKDSKKIV